MGVSGSDMTLEYLRAVETYGLSYADLKRMERASLEHGFIPGDSLWSNAREMRRGAACADEKTAGDRLPAKCQKPIDGERAPRALAIGKSFCRVRERVLELRPIELSA